jgi:hypothetical protein
MNAIRLQKKIESETLHLPELNALIGETVEIIVLHQASAASTNDGASTKASRYSAFFDLAGTDAVDPDAYQQLRTASRL